MRWAAFAQERPDLAAEGQRLLYQFGLGLGFLATVAKDGSPRVHPMCPMFFEGGLYAFIEPGPKRGDLVRDGRYALHCYPPPQNEDAFYVTGRAILVEDASLRARIEPEWAAERKLDEAPPQLARNLLFELDVERCLVTKAARGDWEPQHTVWHAADR
ncbi:MAG TPA: pyridoxamine 5'-phosphate oxidase family protein [Acidimicrobiales bacterium]